MTISFVLLITLTFCFSYTSVVGKATQGNSKVTKWNHYLIGGFAQVKVSNSKVMAEAYQITLFKLGRVLLMV